MEANQLRVCDDWVRERMNIPLAVWQATYQKMPPEIRRPFRIYVTRIDELLADGVGFLVTGPATCGKTCAGVVLLKAGWERGHSGYYTTVKELRQAAKDNLDFDSSESVMSRVRSIDLLVVDDFLADEPKNFSFSLSDLEHLLKTRSARGKTTVLLTSLSKEVLAADCPSMLSTLSSRFHAITCSEANYSEAHTAKMQKLFGG